MEQAAQEILNKRGSNWTTIPFYTASSKSKNHRIAFPAVKRAYERFYLNLENTETLRPLILIALDEDPVGTHSAQDYIVGRFGAGFMGSGAPENSLISARHL